MREWIIALSALAYAGSACAHGGGLDRHGCHHDRKNGDYHCHRAAAPEPPRVSANDFAPIGSAPQTQALRPAASAGTAFRNCTHARAAGAAPVRRGDPGYGTHLDRDGDGVGCE